MWMMNSWYYCILGFVIYSFGFNILAAQRNNVVQGDTFVAYEHYRIAQQWEKKLQSDSAAFYYLQAAYGYRTFSATLQNTRRTEEKRRHVWLRSLEAQVSAAWSINMLGHSDSAIHLLLQVDSLVPLTIQDSSRLLSKLYGCLGAAYMDNGAHEKAISAYGRSLELKQQVFGPNHSNVAVTYNNLGNLYKKMGRFEESISHYEQAKAIFIQQLGAQDLKVVISDLNIAGIYISAGDLDRALDLYQQCVSSIKGRVPLPKLELSSCYNNMGAIYERKNNYLAAREYYGLSIGLFHTLFGRSFPDLALRYNNMGNICYFLGEYQHAIAYYNQAIAVRAPSKKHYHPDFIHSNLGIGACYTDLGDITKALHFNRLALEQATGLYGKEHPEVASVWLKLGISLVLSQDTSAARAAFDQSIAIWQQHFGPQYSGIAAAYQNIGQIYYDQVNLVQSIHFYEKALYIRERDQRPEAIVATLITLSQCYLQLGQWNKAISFAERSLALGLTTAAPDHYQSLKLKVGDQVVLKALYFNTAALLKRGQPDDSAKAFAAIRFADRLVDSLRMTHQYESDKIECSNTATPIYHCAINLFSRLPAAHQEAFFYAEKVKAVALAQMLHESEASHLSTIPDSLVSQDRKRKLDLIYYNQTILQLEEKCPKCDSARLAELVKSRFATIEELQQLHTLIEDRYPQYHALKYKNLTASIHDLQSALSQKMPQTAVLSYVLTDSALVSFLITPKQYQVHRQPLTWSKDPKKNDLSRMITQLVKAVADPKLAISSPKPVIEAATQLYQLLIKPFEQYIGGKDLIIIPDGELYKVPFELLINPGQQVNTLSKWQDLPYLIKKYNISYCYSATLLLESLEKKSQNPVPSSGFLAFAPVFDDTSTGKIVSNENTIEQSYITYVSRGDTVSRAFMNDGKFIRPLPGTEREVKAIYELFNQKNLPAKYYLNDQANESTVKSLNLKPYKYLHFATHGLTDEDRPTQSCLILAQNQFPKLPAPNGEGSKTQLPSPIGEGSNDNLLTSSEMYGLELDAELVVLSACQTGKGTLKAGEGIIGLTRGLLYAGARNLMVSQWNVNDASTAELMTKFYSKILAGQSNRQALREAKLELLNSKFACPHYWSAFVLVGR
jgi:CHAT domain-containing protein